MKSKVASRANAADYEFVQVTRTARELDEEVSRIVADEPALRLSRVDLVAVFPAPERDGVLVQVSSAIAQSKAVLQQRYGESVTVEHKAAANPFDSRLNDSAPWNGGDVIAMDNGQECSSGPAIVRGGRTQLLTAGHCFTDAVTGLTGLTGYTYRVFQRSRTQPGGVNTAPIGYAAAERDGYDEALIDVRAYGRDWRTQNMTDAGTTAAIQRAAESSVGGMRVCTSGAFDGEICNGTVIHAGGTVVTPDGRTLIHETEITSPGSILVGPGDSGGPVYEVHSTGLWVTGVITAGPSDLWCVKYPGRNVDPATGMPKGECSDDAYYQEVVSVLSHFGATLYTP
jgi:hypothetical protein